MARIKYYLYNPDSKIETPIYLSITYNGNRAKLKTQQKIKPKAWNKLSNSVRKNWTEYSDVQIQLDRIEAIVKSKLNSLIDEYGVLPRSKELKSVLEYSIFGNNIKVEDLSFLFFYNDFLEKLPKKISPKTGKFFFFFSIGGYRQTQKVLQEFESLTNKHISFLTIANDLYDDLIEFFQVEKVYSINTIGKHIKHLKP